MTSKSDTYLMDHVVRFLIPIGDEVALRAVNSAVMYTRKTSAGDLVTELDLEVQDRLRSFLGELVPDSSFVGEESASNANHGSVIWIVDPIDGTTNMVHGLRYASISVALLRDGKVVFGVVHNIFERKTAFAIVGDGAHEVSEDHAQSRLKVSNIGSLNEALVSFGLPYDRANSSRLFSTAERVFGASQDLRRQGSAALDLVSIASGRMEAHFELDLRLWDIAAAGLILEEAGGVITDWDGCPVTLGDPDARISVEASNGQVHDELSELLSLGTPVGLDR